MQTFRQVMQTGGHQGCLGTRETSGPEIFSTNLVLHIKDSQRSTEQGKILHTAPAWKTADPVRPNHELLGAHQVKSTVTKGP